MVSELLIRPVSTSLNGTKVNCTEVHTTVNNPDIAIIMVSTTINIIHRRRYTGSINSLNTCFMTIIYAAYIL